MDFFDRISGFFESAGPLGLAAALLLGLILLVLTIMNQRRFLLGTYLVLLMFSGFSSPAVDGGATLLRWVVIALLGVTCVRGGVWPGWPAVLLGLYAIFSLLLAPAAPSVLWAIQVAMLMLVLALPMASSAATTLTRMVDVERLLKLFLMAAALYVLLGLSSLGSLKSGARFSGASSSAPLFVMTGGLLLPIAVWGIMSPALRAWRWYCVGVACCTFMLCIVSGERTGTFAGLIACLPLLARLGIRRLGISVVVILLAAGLLHLVLSQMPDHADFVQKRFLSTDTTGRTGKWSQALALCLEDPILGHGLGASGTNFGFHNAYLVVWYDGGLVGLSFYCAAMLIMAWKSFRLICTSRDRQFNDIGRLLLGLVLGTMAAAFFESKLTSPSNIAVFTVVIASVILARLDKIRQEEATLAEQDALSYDPAQVWADDQAASGPLRVNGYAP